MKIFTKEKVNTGRQAEVDLLRGFTAISLIIVHVGLYLGSNANTGLYTFCDIYGSELGAPIFMILMGIGIIYSRHQGPKEMLKRGICLLALGYGLSFFRSIIPLLIFGNIDEWASIEAFFVVDILQFAGITFMFLALLKKLKLPNVVILVISIIMVLIDQLIMLPESIPWNSELLTALVNLFCPVTEWSCFPFLTWFFFPAFGMVFGEMLMRCNNKKRLYSILLPVGLLGVLYVYYQFYLLYPDYTSYYFGHNFYYMGLKNVVLTAFFAFFGLGFWYFVDKILPNSARKFLNFLSVNLNVFYIFSWIIISVLIHLQAIYQWSFGVAAIIGIMALSFILCIVLAILFRQVKKKLKV